MKVLGIEASAAVAGVAVLDNDRLVYEAYHHHKKNHSEILMPLVEEALASSGTTLQQIDVFAVTKGPGSFTGLRIGIATVKGLAQSVDKPVAAIPTLDSLAYNIIFDEGLVCPIMDARRDQVYTCTYKRVNGRYKMLHDYQAVHITDLAEQLLKHNLPVMFTGDGIPAYKETLVSLLHDNALFAPPVLMLQRASVTAWLGRTYAEEGRCVSYKELLPFYLRQSQAEQKKAMNTGESR